MNGKLLNKSAWKTTSDRETMQIEERNENTKLAIENTKLAISYLRDGSTELSLPWSQGGTYMILNKAYRRQLLNSLLGRVAIENKLPIPKIGDIEEAFKDQKLLHAYIQNMADTVVSAQNPDLYLHFKMGRAELESAALAYKAIKKTIRTLTEGDVLPGEEV